MSRRLRRPLPRAWTHFCELVAFQLILFLSVEEGPCGTWAVAGRHLKETFHFDAGISFMRCWVAVLERTLLLKLSRYA